MSPIEEACALLREEAKLIADTHTTNGEWVDEPEAKEKHDRLIRVAGELAVIEAERESVNDYVRIQ